MLAHPTTRYVVCNSPADICAMSRYYRRLVTCFPELRDKERQLVLLAYTFALGIWTTKFGSLVGSNSAMISVINNFNADELNRARSEKKKTPGPAGNKEKPPKQTATAAVWHSVYSPIDHVL